MPRRSFAGLAVVAVLGVGAGHAQIASEQRLGSTAGVVSTGVALALTRDSGRHWADITPPGGRRIAGASFLDAADGWALIAGAEGGWRIARTRDGGRGWTDAAFPLAPDEAVTFSGEASLDFLDARHGWAVTRQIAGSGFSIARLRATADGGATWTELPSPPLADPVSFLTPEDGWQAGGPTGDQLYATRDAGRTWARVRVSPPPGVPSAATPRYGLPMPLAGGGLALVATWRGDGEALTALMTSRDGGATWRAASLSRAASENAPAATTAAGRLITVDAAVGSLASRLDGGAAVAGRRIDPEASIDAADFADPSHGWIVVTAGRCAGFKRGCAVDQRLLATEDGGRDFADVTPPAIGAVPVVDATLGSGEGFDVCSPTISGLAKWYKASPYRSVNVYLGGSAAYCPQPGLTRAWVNTVAGQGWALIPTWVGPQAPCTSATGTPRFSSNPATAASQGASEASRAGAKMNAIGLTGAPIYYDMEYYNDTRSCAAATKAFIGGWVQGLHGAGYVAGVYGSPTNAAADWVGLASAPDDVWLALWNGVAGVFDLPPLPNTAWPNHQRLHQYKGNVNQTFGGVHYNIDQDYLDGPVAK